MLQSADFPAPRMCQKWRMNAINPPCRTPFSSMVPRWYWRARSCWRSVSAMARPNSSQADRENWTFNFLFLQARAKNARSSSEICQSKEIRAIPTNLAKRHRRRRAPRSSRQSRAALLMFILPCGQIIICGPNIHSSTNRYSTGIPTVVCQCQSISMLRLGRWFKAQCACPLR
jgi:hypothetical protein